METPEIHPVTIELTIEAGDWGEEAAVRAEIERAITAATKVGRFDLPPYAELSVVLTDDAHIRELNRTWRGKDKATNVLSFPAGEQHEAEISDDYADPPLLLGDIVVARETLVREAEEETKSVANHFTHLLVHGFVHLMGYDHEDDAEAEEMEALEAEILAHLGIANPYAD